MNSLFGILAAPTAAGALDMAGRAVKTATTPFDIMLQAASKAAGAAEETSEEQQEPSTLKDQVAMQLQQLLQSLGMSDGEGIVLSIDDAGRIEVADGHPQADQIEAALRDDETLSDQIRKLAEDGELVKISPFHASSRLSVQVAEDSDQAILSWQ